LSTVEAGEVALFVVDARRSTDGLSAVDDAGDDSRIVSRVETFTHDVHGIERRDGGKR
jgi:hypothetical protein